MAPKGHLGLYLEPIMCAFELPRSGVSGVAACAAMGKKTIAHLKK